MIIQNMYKHTCAVFLSVGCSVQQNTILDILMKSSRVRSADEILLTGPDEEEGPPVHTITGRG